MHGEQTDWPEEKYPALQSAHPVLPAPELMVLLPAAHGRQNEGEEAPRAEENVHTKQSSHPGLPVELTYLPWGHLKHADCASFGLK